MKRRLAVAGSAAVLTVAVSGWMVGVGDAQDGAVRPAAPVSAVAPSDHTPKRTEAAERPSRSETRATPKPTPSSKPVPTSSSPAARSSRKPPTPTGFTAWRNSAKAKSVIQCESGGNYKITNPSGKYRGAWQMDSNFWKAYGGLKFAPKPDLATPHEQDLVAYNGWLARGWQPWSCA